MTPYVTSIVSHEEIKLWKAVSWVVDSVPADFMSDFSFHGEAIRCHELARAVRDWVAEQPPLRWGSQLVKLRVIDGRYAAIEHTWLETGFGENILDVYVPGEMPPVQLRHGSKFLPGQYVPGKPRSDIREDVVESLLGFFRIADNETLNARVVAAVTAP